MLNSHKYTLIALYYDYSFLPFLFFLYLLSFYAYFNRERLSTRGGSRLCHFVNRRWRCHCEKFRRLSSVVNADKKICTFPNDPTFSLLLSERERKSGPSLFVTKKLDLLLQPVTLYGARSSGAPSLLRASALQITILSIDSIRLAIRRRTLLHAAALYAAIVTFSRLPMKRSPLHD